MPPIIFLCLKRNTKELQVNIFNNTQQLPQAVQKFRTPELKARTSLYNLLSLENAGVTVLSSGFEAIYFVHR